MKHTICLKAKKNSLTLKIPLYPRKEEKKLGDNYDDDIFILS